MECSRRERRSRAGAQLVGAAEGRRALGAFLERSRLRSRLCAAMERLAASAELVAQHVRMRAANDEPWAELFAHLQSVEGERTKVLRNFLVEVTALREEVKHLRQIGEASLSQGRSRTPQVVRAKHRVRPSGPRPVADGEVQPNELDVAAAERLLRAKGVRPV